MLYVLERGERTPKRVGYTTKPDDKRPTEEGRVKQGRQREKEGFTAWGEEVVGSLQAGWASLPARSGPTATAKRSGLVVRVRNVGKKDVQFLHLRQFLKGTSPSVTDDNGKRVPFNCSVETHGRPKAQKVDLAPGEEIEIYELVLSSRPASESDDKVFSTLYGTGKFRVQFRQVGPDYLDSRLSQLATGKLELEIEDE